MKSRIAEDKPKFAEIGKELKVELVRIDKNKNEK
jgi:hypothetical protein